MGVQRAPRGIIPSAARSPLRHSHSPTRGNRTRLGAPSAPSAMPVLSVASWGARMARPRAHLSAHAPPAAARRNGTFALRDSCTRAAPNARTSAGVRPERCRETPVARTRLTPRAMRPLPDRSRRYRVACCCRSIGARTRHNRHTCESAGIYSPIATRRHSPFSGHMAERVGKGRDQTARPDQPESAPRVGSSLERVD